MPRGLWLAEKYLSDIVYLEAEQGLDTQSSKASVQVEVTPNITFDSEIGANSEGGIGGSEACRGKKKVLTSCGIYFITNPEVSQDL